MTTTNPRVERPDRPTPAAIPVVHTELRKGSVGLAGVVMHSLAHIAPAP